MVGIGLIKGIEMKKVAIFLTLFLSTYCMAGSVTNAKISRVYCGIVSGIEMCSVYFDKSIDGPSCQTLSPQRMQFQVNSEMGKSLLSLALMAYSTKREVYLKGKNTCDIFSGLEDLELIELL